MREIVRSDHLPVVRIAQHQHADVAGAQRGARCGQDVFTPALVDAGHSPRSRRAMTAFIRL